MLWGVSRWLVGVRGGRGVVCAAIGVLWVGAYSSPLFLLLPVFPWAAGNRKVAAWGECLVSSFA